MNITSSGGRFIIGAHGGIPATGLLLSTIPCSCFEPINIRINCTKIMKLLSVDEQTYRRLGSIMNDMMHTEKRNINYDDVINELIDVYQERLALSGENAGG